MTQIPPRPITVEMRIESGAIDAALSDLSAALPKLRDLSLEAFDRLIGFIEAGAELFVLDVDRGATPGANEIRVVAQPSDGLRIILAAARAGDFNLAVVEQAFGHGSHPSVGGLAIPTVTESPAVDKAAGDEAKPIHGGPA